MDLDFIFFPAPKESVDISYGEEGKVIWIPKLSQLYPSFKGYIRRKTKKNVAVFLKFTTLQLEEQLFALIDDNQDFSKSPIPKFPIIHRQDLNKKDSISDIIQEKEEINSPEIEFNESSPENISLKINRLNKESIQFLTQNKRDSQEILPMTKKRETTSRSTPQNIIPYQNNEQSEIAKGRRNSQQRGERNNIGYIPCLFFKYESTSNIIIYFHGNAEDITQSYHFLKTLQSKLQISVLAVEYPGYGKYQSIKQPNAETIQNDAEYIYNYLTKKLGYLENNIIIFGRSIGSGPATYLASKHNPGCLVLMSPFTSLKDAVRDYIRFVGNWLQHLIKQRFNNLENMKDVTCPTFILHGEKDDMIPWKQAELLKNNCQAKECVLHLGKDMDHISYKLYSDLLIPLSEFLTTIHFYKIQQKGPKLPTHLYRSPLGNGQE